MILTNSLECNTELAFPTSGSTGEVPHRFEAETTKISKTKRELVYTWGLFLLGAVLALSNTSIDFNSPVRGIGVCLSLVTAIWLAVGQVKKWWSHFTHVLFDPVDDVIME